jgi:hypothetical protein
LEWREREPAEALDDRVACLSSLQWRTTTQQPAFLLY